MERNTSPVVTFFRISCHTENPSLGLKLSFRQRYAVFAANLIAERTGNLPALLWGNVAEWEGGSQLGIRNEELGIERGEWREENGELNTTYKTHRTDRTNEI